jgi:hypothetical protein
MPINMITPITITTITTMPTTLMCTVTMTT